MTIGVEHVEGVAGCRHGDGVAYMYWAVSISTYYEILTVLQRQIDKISFAKVFDDTDFTGKYFITLRVFQKMFWPQPNCDGVSGLDCVGCNIGADFLTGTEFDREKFSADHRYRTDKEIHFRRTDKGGYEQVFRTLIQLQR